MGIDCSGFTQMVYKINGIKLERDATNRHFKGQTLSFIEESEAGDLAFFDDAEGKITHVGFVRKSPHYSCHGLSESIELTSPGYLIQKTKPYPQAAFYQKNDIKKTSNWKVFLLVIAKA